MIDIEKHDELHRYLVEKQLIHAREEVKYENLTGGVSNRCVLVTRDAGNLVVKQALEKLRVKETWKCAPERIHKEALGLRHLKQLTPHQNTPAFVDEDFQQHMLVMKAVLFPHHNLKTLLLEGKISSSHASQLGALLGSIHANSLEKEEYKTAFSETHFFEALRLNPYYAFTASQLPEVAGFLSKLTETTKQVKISVVHGDFSPKNILVHDGQLILLDHEVIHYGDPAFDIGFSLTHLLSKGVHLKTHREDMLKFSLTYWKAYCTETQPLLQLPEFENRAVQHTLACLLARVKGKSPLEYLDKHEQVQQLSIVLNLLNNRPASVENLIHKFFNALTK